MPISAEQWKVSIGLIYTIISVVSRCIVRSTPWSVLWEVLVYLCMQCWSGGSLSQRHLMMKDVCKQSVMFLGCNRKQDVISRKKVDSGFLMLVLCLAIAVFSLMLSGDVESNPGPIGTQTHPDTSMAQAKQLETRFSNLKGRIHDHVTKNMDLNQFRDALIHMSNSVHMRHEYQKFINNILLNVDPRTTTKDLLIELECYSDFLNYTVVEHMAHELGDQGIQKDMIGYVHDLKEFRRSTRLCDFIEYSVWPNRKKICESELSTVVVKVNKTWESCTLEDVEELKMAITQNLVLPSFVFMFNNACEGSFVTTWLVPRPIATVLKDELANMEGKEFLKKHQIDLITVDGQECFYSAIKKYAVYLKEIYLSNSGKNLSSFQLAQIENEGLKHTSDHSFSRESIQNTVDDIHNKKNPLHENWCPEFEKRVLIDGAPGVGKTTYSSQICYRWARGEILQHYSLVILLPLRDNQVRSANSIHDFFYNSTLQRTIAQEVESAQGEGVALLLEGWDELDEKLQQNSIFSDLLCGHRLPKAAMFVTSRPWASDSIKDMPNLTHVELLTTPKVQIGRLCREERVRPSLSKEFVDYLNSQPVIKAAMHTPMASNLIAEVFQWIHDTEPKPRPKLPATMTQLYSTYVLKVIQKKTSMKSITSFSDLPPDVYKQFLSLCKFAYDSILKQQLVFAIGDLPLDYENLGVVRSVGQLYSKNGRDNSYEFIHLTVQEFLAAFHMCQLPEDELEGTLVCKYVSLDNFIIVLRFLAGLNHLKHLHLKHIPDLLNETSNVTLFHWIFEANNNEVTSKFLEHKDLQNEDHKIFVTSTWRFWTPLDFYVTGYCLALSNSMWHLFFRLYGINDEGLQMFCRGVWHKSENRGCIRQANFGNSNIIFSGGRFCFTRLPDEVLYYLVELQLYYIKLDQGGLTQLARLAIPRMKALEELNLNGNPNIGNGGAIDLFNALYSCSTLRHLSMYQTGIGPEDSDGLGELLVRSSLEYLDVSGNELLPLESIMEGLRKNKTLKYLDITGSQLTAKASKSLSLVLEQSTVLETLTMKDCKITAEIAIQLAEGLTNNRSLCFLSLSENPIGDEGAIRFGIALSENKNMKILYLLRSSITVEGAKNLVKQLIKNSTLAHLAISTSQTSKKVFVQSVLAKLQTEKTEELEDSGISIFKETEELEDSGKDYDLVLVKDIVTLTEESVMKTEETNETKQEILKHDVTSIPVPTQPKSEDQYHDVSVDSIPKLTILNPLPSQTQTTGWVLRGVEVCEETTVVVTKSKMLFYWEGYGLKLHIPDSCLPPGVEQCSINIKVSLAGQYQFPEDTHLVSAVYWLQCTPRCEFVKAVSIEISHCSNQDDMSTLSIVRSHCTQEKLPYTFKEIQGGVFTKYSSYGLIERKRFSGYAATQKRTKERRYYGCVYYLHREIDFVITWDDKAHREVTRKHYERHGAKNGAHFPIEFDSDKISLDIPMDGVIVSNFWKVIPLKPPVITKRLVDSHRVGREIPSCQLESIMIPSTQDVKAADLVLSINLTGAKAPYNKYNIVYQQLPEEPTSPAQSLSPGPSPSKSPTHYKTLCPKDLGNLLKELLSTVADQWENIGYMLEIEEGRLNIVKEDNKSSQACLREMLKIWLKRDNPPPTWPAIIEAVKALGYESLANDLESKYYLSVYKY